VEARLSARRSIVAINSTVGNELKSSGRSINSEVSRIRTENVIDTASSTSSSTLGKGSTSTTRIATTPTASNTSVWAKSRVAEPKARACKVAIKGSAPSAAHTPILPRQG